MSPEIIHIAKQLIPPAGSRSELKYAQGDTDDIVRVILFADAHSDNAAMKPFAEQLMADTLRGTCRNIWTFWKDAITYREDPPGIQNIKSPMQLWKDRVGDCKSFSIAVASCLRALKLRYYYRFVSFSKRDKTPTHVYVVVPAQDGEIIIDCVWTAFDSEKAYAHKTDIPMTQISYVHGIPGVNSRSLVNQIDDEAPEANDTVLQLPDSFMDTGEITEGQLLLSAAKQRLAVDKRNLLRGRMRDLQLAPSRSRANIDGIPGLATRKTERLQDYIDAISDIQANMENPDRIGEIIRDVDNGKYFVADYLLKIQDEQRRFLERARLAKQRSQAQFLRTKEGRIQHLTDRIQKNLAMAEKCAADGKKEKASLYRDHAEKLKVLLTETQAISGPGEAYIGKSKFGKFLQKAASTVKKAAGDVGKAVIKVATYPARLAVKGILEVSLPSAAPGFIYVFINKQEIIDKLPAKVKEKRRRQMKIADFIVNAIGMKRSHMMGLLRNGIKKRYGKDPEAVLSSTLHMAVSGIGILPAAAMALANPEVRSKVIESLKKIFDIISKIFGKKADSDSGDFGSAIASEDDFAGLTPPQQKQLASDIQKQPTTDSVEMTIQDIDVQDGGRSIGWC